MIQIQTPDTSWGRLVGQIHDFLKADLIHLTLDGRPVSGFRSPDSKCLWIRDHQDITRGARYFFPDLKSTVEAFAVTQTIDGRIFDNVTTTPETKTGERENWEKWIRVQVEADVEYRFVKAAYIAWQSTGDDAWMERMIPHMDKALRYCMNHLWRWDEQHQLVKRAYTIDTWDFDYTAGRAPWLNFDITEHTFWGIFHGDNSGMVESSRMLAAMYAYIGNDEQAAYWQEVADGIRERANKLLFNGRFYTHFYKLVPVTVPGVDEAEQLSLSNPMAIVRGMATHDIAVAVIREYQRRADETGVFAPWWGIHPPFPDGSFGDEKLIGGAYINGGIFPMSGAELALGAFEHGFETYGVEQLRKYQQIVFETGQTFLWYFPDGSPSTEETSTSPDALPTDGWGSSAMLMAFTEGLAGIKDLGRLFSHVRLSPRWLAAEQDDADITLGYEASGATIGYTFNHTPEGREITVDIRANDSLVDLHLLLPEGARPHAVEIDGQSVPFVHVTVQHSSYVDASFMVEDAASVRVTYH